MQLDKSSLICMIEALFEFAELVLDDDTLQSLSRQSDIDLSKVPYEQLLGWYERLNRLLKSVHPQSQ